jgi:hypothetical protein
MLQTILVALFAASERDHCKTLICYPAESNGAKPMKVADRGNLLATERVTRFIFWTRVS